MDKFKTRLIHLVSLCSDYCVTLENASSMERTELVATLLGYLPRIYFEFHDIPVPEDASIDEWSVPLASHLDEDTYESVRHRLAVVMGEHDTYLETFENDMKYSDTPIAATISENLADIFQPLFNMVVETRESDGDNMVEAFRECAGDFRRFWSQTLCNVMRALNALEFNETDID
ncbi:MAG: DUF5063 domain-containing protein [Muribaculaceae bacterium]|nr:DUF5063 domain-containing protein [Muribaculaceae bacterium]